MSNYTQPVCDPCWIEEKGDWENLLDSDGKEEYVPISYAIPTVVKGFPLEVCCLCGRHTISGIYIRRNPAYLPYPTIIPDET